MRRKLILSLAVACLAGAAWAGEPWKDKPSTSWTDADVRRILDDSPWAKTVTIAATWLRTGAQGLEVGTKISIPPRAPGQVEDSDLKNPPPIHDKLYDQYARFLLRWESSRTVRTALQIRAQRQGPLSSSPGVPPLAAEPLEYELLLVGDSLAPFPMATDSELKANTALLFAGSRRKVAATRVIVRRRDDGQILEVRFFFGKRMASGQPALAAGEKAVEFQCQVGGTILRARFEPARMVDAEGLDLR
jgi:hypothetical protein